MCGLPATCNELLHVGLPRCSPRLGTLEGGAPGEKVNGSMGGDESPGECERGRNPRDRPSGEALAPPFVMAGSVCRVPKLAVATPGGAIPGVTSAATEAPPGAAVKLAGLGGAAGTVAVPAGAATKLTGADTKLDGVTPGIIDGAACGGDATELIGNDGMGTTAIGADTKLVPGVVLLVKCPMCNTGTTPAATFLWCLNCSSRSPKLARS